MLDVWQSEALLQRGDIAGAAMGFHRTRFMQLRVLFFGETSALVGCRELFIESPPSVSASMVFSRIVDQYPTLSKRKLHLALNQRYTTGDEIVSDGDEIAIFTAVSGG